MSRLLNPDRRLSANAYPYLRKPSRNREAALGDLPSVEEGYLLPGPDARVQPPLSGGLDSFTGPVSPTFMEPGERYYRAVGDGQYPNGAFWSTTAISTEEELRTMYAVRNDWNGDGGLVVFIPRRRVPAWEGTVAPQQGTSVTDKWLPGGARQVWIEPGSVGPTDGDWYIGPLPRSAAP
jgi:hypothetical protein